MAYTDGLLKMLQSHISRDETRYHLCGAFFEDGKAIATDGHRMLIVHNTSASADLCQIAQSQKGKIYSFKGHSTVEGKYPNYQQLIPKTDSSYQSLKCTIPTWFKSIKSGKPVAMLFFTPKGWQSYKPDTEPWIAVNPEYLAPFAGLDVIVKFKGSLTPLTVEAQEDSNWLAVIMPLRA